MRSVVKSRLLYSILERLIYNFDLGGLQTTKTAVKNVKMEKELRLSLICHIATNIWNGS